MLDQDNEGGTFGGLEITRRRILFTSGGLNLSTSPVPKLERNQNYRQNGEFYLFEGLGKNSQFAFLN